jgi:hypothetical protein
VLHQENTGQPTGKRLVFVNGELVTVGPGDRVPADATTLDQTAMKGFAGDQP